MTKRATDIFRDERGGIMVVAAIGLVLIIAVMALSIDHGRNYLRQSDLEARLTALTKQAGEEFTYWDIRRQINAAATQLGMQGVNDEDCQLYVLCLNNQTEAQAVEKLRAFIETEIRRTNATVAIAAVPSGEDGFIHVNSIGYQYLRFKATDTQANEVSGAFGAGGATTINVESGVLINNFRDQGTASQIVYSLDKESETQLDGANDDLKKTFQLVKAAITAMGIQSNEFRVGLTIGNLPVRGPTNDGTAIGTVVAGGLQGTFNDDMGFSGSLYDNAPGFDGTDVGGARLANQTRKYVVEASFVATDAAQCGNPVWAYRNAKSGTCQRGVFETVKLANSDSLVSCLGDGTEEPKPDPVFVTTPAEGMQIGGPYGNAGSTWINLDGTMVEPTTNYPAPKQGYCGGYPCTRVPGF